MTFKTAYGRYVNESTPVGSDEAPDFGYVKESVADYDANGKKIGSHDEIVFKQVGSHSITQYINSFNDTTDIKKIFEKYQAGDVSVLTKRVGDYIDTLGCPDNLLDAKLMMLNGENLYNQLPTDIKEKYDNSVDKFIEAALNGKLSEDFDLKSKEADKAQVDEIASLKAQIADLQKGVKYE